MKQTSVEWLKAELWRQFNFSFSDNILEKALEMHRDEIIESHYEGQCDNHEGYPLKISKEYYDKTYGKETHL